MDVNLIPWTQDGIAGCYMRFQDSNGEPTGQLWKLDGMNSFDSQRNAAERTLLGDNTTYIKNTKFNDFAITANFAGLIGDVMDAFLSGEGYTEGDTYVFDELVTGQPKKIVLYKVSDLVSKNGDVGQSLETFWDAQFQNLGNPTTSGDLALWQGTISALAKLRNGKLTPRQFRFVKNGIALPAVTGDTTPPEVESTIPIQGATAVPVSTNITMVFDEAVDVSSLASVELVKLSDGTQHELGTPTYNAGTFTAVWDPTTNLSASSLYLLRAPRGKVKDVAGNYLASDVHRTFTTA